MTVRRILGIAIHVASSLAFAAIAVTVAYFLTAFIYRRSGWQPPILAAQIINTLLGMFFMIMTVVISGLSSRSRRKGPFAPIIDALGRIATGDFSTRLDDSHRAHGVVGELAQSVNVMALKLDQMEKMRQEFISDVSHEIQSPLTSIRGFASALQQEDLHGDVRRHYLGIIEAETTRLSKLSANLLKLASLESEQVKFEPKNYRLDSQLRNLVLACETQWAEKQLEMDVALEEATIRADEDLLGQVWTNLIYNSIKFSSEGGSVQIALQRRADQLEVRFADTGSGIALEDQRHIFERFYKGDKSRRPSEGGSGLGLAIAKKVIEMHRGTIAVQSLPGAGAVFVVTLPLQ